MVRKKAALPTFSARARIHSEDAGSRLFARENQRQRSGGKIQRHGDSERQPQAE